MVVKDYFFKNFNKWFILLITTISTSTFAMPTFNMTPGVTPISQDIYFLHMTIFTICVMIGLLVFGILIYTLITHRKSKGFRPASFHEHTRLEVFWAIVPFLILVVMAVPATKVLSRMNDDSKPDINIKIVGYQWRWQYQYLDEGITYFSNLSTPIDQLQNKQKKGQWYLLEVDKPLVVPIHKKIRFLVTSNDVIHSWWVPALGIKRDAIPGFIYEAWARIDKPGTYRGQCAELCGINHAYMPIVVKAVTQEDYQKWLQQNAPGGTQPAIPGQIAEQAQTKPAIAAANLTREQLMQQGEKVYTQICAVCHQANGQGMPPTFPGLKGDKITTGPVSGHINVVLNGVPGTAMQAFKDQLSDQDLAAVITYERNSWGNDKAGGSAGGLVQPADITAAKNKLPEKK